VESYDVVVVGAGPGGSVAARAAAEGGARVLLVDQRATIGVPVQCGEFLPTVEELKDLFDCPTTIDAAFRIPPGTVLRTITTMACVAPTGRRFVFPLRGVSVSRSRFDQALARAAEAAGATLRHPAGVTRVRDDIVEFAQGAPVRARVVIGADGPISTVARSSGIVLPRTLYRMITATCAGSFPDEIDLFFGRVAPGGYAWMIPKDGSANVGLGVPTVPRGQTLGRLLDRFTARERYARGTERTQWWVPIGPPPSSAVRGRSLLTGDAANLVMATNGGGIPTAMISGYDAGQVAAQHVREGSPLAAYDARLREHLAIPLARAHRVKEFGDRVVGHDLLLSLGMRYIGAAGLDAMMRLRWPARLGRTA
jgi:digeranylgeranylglycerophospholipid reductase